MNRDLFLAILSMDSYNRGYGQGVNLSGTSIQIGNATIIKDSIVLTVDGTRVDIAAGFYAIAYDMTGVSGFSSGEQVIAYRGSDEGRAQDIILGYPTALAWPLTPQGLLAVDFARAVVGNNANPVTAGQHITVTGHSLGAGLGGYISGLYGWDGVLFDPMPYSTAVMTSYAYALTHSGYAAQVYGNFSPTLPNLANKHGYYIPTQLDTVASNNLALEFYKAVAGRDAVEGGNTSNTASVTIH